MLLDVETTESSSDLLDTNTCIMWWVKDKQREVRIPFVEKIRKLSISNRLELEHKHFKHPHKQVSTLKHQSQQQYTYVYNIINIIHNHRIQYMSEVK